MNIVLTITLLLFALFIVRVILFWVSLWQLKEYRWDRLSVHLRDTKQGHNVLFSYELVLLLLMVAIYMFSIFNDFIAQYFSYLVLLLFVFFATMTVQEFFARRIKRPIFTTKAMSISVLSFFVVILLSVFPLTDLSFWMILLSLSVPIIISCIVGLFAFPTEIYTDIYIQRAKEKRRRFLHLKVIAVSGSYGKSSTKEIIAHMLSEKYVVVKTPLSQNTPLAVAKTMLTKVKVNTDFFIVEMGAYKKGEIKQLADIVSPSMSVTTAVSDQHLALYGNMNDVVLSELELIESLPKGALMLLNANSRGTSMLAEKIKNGRLVWYKTASLPSKKDTVYGLHAQPTIQGVDWIYSNQNTSLPLSSPLLGMHTIENILPAVYLGFLFGLTKEQIKHAIATLRPLSKTMEKISLKSGVHAIDDTFNASPESVASAISYLRLFPKRKILVMSPLIELGKMSKERHREIGRLLANVDIVCLTNKNFLDELQKGIQEKKGKTQLVIGSYLFLADYLKHHFKKGDAVVFEGKEAGIVLHLL